jgi:hypothetical protein
MQVDLFQEVRRTSNLDPVRVDTRRICGITLDGSTSCHHIIQDSSVRARWTDRLSRQPREFRVVVSITVVEKQFLLRRNVPGRHKYDARETSRVHLFPWLEVCMFYGVVHQLTQPCNTTVYEEEDDGINTETIVHTHSRYSQSTHTSHPADHRFRGHTSRRC